MRDSSPAHTVHRNALIAVALAVACLGATSARAFADAKATFDPSSMTFADTVDGAPSAVQTVSLSNPGDAPLTLTGGGVVNVPQFVISNDTCALAGTIAPGATCTVDIAFNATSPEPVGGVLGFTTSVGSRSVLLRGNAPKASADPGTVNLTAAVGSTSAPTPVRLTNGVKATGPLTNIAITVTGPFAVDRTTCDPLVPGDQCIINVTFKPTAAGTFTGKLTFSGSDPILPPPSIALTGTATAGTGTPPPGGTTGKRASVTGFAFSPKLLTLGRRGSFKFTLSADAVVTIVVERRRPGRAVRYQRRATVNIAGKAGANTKAYSASRKLPEGKYRLKITAKNAAGSSTTRTATFTVRRKRS